MQGEMGKYADLHTMSFVNVPLCELVFQQIPIRHAAVSLWFSDSFFEQTEF
jgi:hypothetical protein